MPHGYFATKQALETSYAPARSEWDSRVGAPTVSAYHWRVFALLLLVLLLLAVVGLIYRAGQSQVVPVYVAIDALGEARVLSGLKTEPKPSDAAVGFHLRQFVVNVWSVSSDPAMTKQGWIAAHYFATGTRGHARLKEELGEWLDRPGELARKGTKRVVPEQALRVSDDSWQVDWVTMPVDLSGKAGKPVKHRGTFRLLHVKPKTTQDVVRNPLGIYVDDFHQIEL